MPEFKLWLSTNHKPVVRGTDHAMWRRVRLIPFNVRIPPEKQDKKLDQKLRAELKGILAWAVKGRLQWQAEGLSAPDAVRAATAESRNENDVLVAFLQDCCVLADNASVPNQQLYAR